MISRGSAPSKLQHVALALDGAAPMLGKADQPIVEREEFIGERPQIRILPRAAAGILTERGDQEPLTSGIALERLLPLAPLDQRLDRARLLERARQECSGVHASDAADMDHGAAGALIASQPDLISRSSPATSSSTLPSLRRFASVRRRPA